MGMGCSCCASEKPKYKNGDPPVKGDATPCFDNGRLYQIIHGKKWYFFNDTQDSKMNITVEFLAGSQIEARGKSIVSEEREDGSCTVHLELLPLETEEFVIAKKTNGFKSKFDSTTFSESDKAKFRQAARDRVAEQMDVMNELMKSKKKIRSANQLLKASRKEGKMFVDMYFPPVDQSLVRPGVDAVPTGALSSLDKFCWRRPEDYLPTLWRNKITLYSSVRPNDIDQGSLGDCYFLCSCSALAEFKDHIHNIFANDHYCCIKKSEHKHGGWRVTLSIGGWWRQIIIDSYLPSTSILPSFARNRHHPNELWPSFVEKGYAKAYGSYQTLVAGFPWQALEDLTGYPTYCFNDLWDKARVDEKSQNELFSMLNDWADMGFLVSISTPNNAGTINFKKAGLATGHAYAVLEAKHFPLHRLCMLKIRNPWGNEVEWTGDWGDHSKMWSKYPLVKLGCSPENKDDGVFWMEWKDVVHYFDSGCVCFRRGNWHSTWHDYRVPGTFTQLDRPDIALEIILKNTSFDAYFTLHQKDKRGLASNDPDGVYAAIMLSVCKGEITGTRQEVMASSTSNPKAPSKGYTFQATRSVSLFYSLEKNHRYVVVPRRMQSTSGNNNPTKKFVLGMIASREISGSNVQVNIIKLDANSDVFGNMSAFNTNKVTSISTVYQVRHGTKLFKTKKGTSFNKGKSLERAKYQDVI